MGWFFASRPEPSFRTQRLQSWAPLVLLMGLGACLSGFALAAPADPIPVTLLHTNDLHSHYRTEKGPLRLGGVARLKTALDQIRARAAHSILVDGGDWSDGNVYYRLGTGAASLRMMQKLGYDVVALGNHDFLNGPDRLLDAHAQAGGQPVILAANVQANAYRRANDFNRQIVPFAIREFGSVRIAFIGLTTYEFMYDSFLKPVEILSPFARVRDLAATLRPGVDAIVVISHNNINLNQYLLRIIPDVDVVVGAHDHKKLTSPIVVTEGRESPGYLVETGSWGQYLGKMELAIAPRALSGGANSNRFKLLSYELVQIDSRFAENPEIENEVSQLETLLEQQMGPIFHEEIGHSHSEFSRTPGPETLIGDLVTDAYRAAIPVDFAIDHSHMIYGALHKGPLQSVDIYNANPAVYDPSKNQSWTLKTLELKGRTLMWLFNVLASSLQFTTKGVPAMSGLEVSYQLAWRRTKPPTAPEKLALELFSLSNPSAPSMEPDTIVREMKIGGQPIDLERTYRVASGGGLMHAIDFLNSLLPGSVPIQNLRDTGMEDWRIVADYVRKSSPLEAKDLRFGERMRSVPADLGIDPSSIRFAPLRSDPDGVTGILALTVKNYGTTAYPGSPSRVRAMINLNGNDLSKDPRYLEIGSPRSIPALAPLAKTDITWTVTLPSLLSDPENGIALTGEISQAEFDINATNNLLTEWVENGVFNSR